MKWWRVVTSAYFLSLRRLEKGMSPVTTELTNGVWFEAKDGDVRALGLMKRHYSWHEYKDGRPHKIFVGPGEKMVLLTPNADALFVWRKFIDKSGQQGVNCAVFRNESCHLSSLLIIAACELAWQRWPGERLYTYVNSRKIQSSNPGYCYLQAGWNKCGLTKAKKLVILEIKPQTFGEKTV